MSKSLGTKVSSIVDCMVVCSLPSKSLFSFMLFLFEIDSIVSACKNLNLPIPRRPDPIYTFFPLVSPLKKNDQDGYNMGDDNCLKSIEIKDGALQVVVSRSCSSSISFICHCISSQEILRGRFVLLL